MTALRDAIDYTTLGWVKPELDETLRQARIEIEGFVDDPSDTSRMRFCASYLHQVQGTLRMVELYAPAMVTEEMERLAQALDQKRLALCCRVGEGLDITDMALIGAPEIFGRQGTELFPVGHLVHALNALGGFLRAFCADFPHRIKPLLAAFLQQAGDLQLQLDVGLVKVDG